MARLALSGGESRIYGAVAANGEGQGVFSSGTVTADTANQFDGSVCQKCGPSAANLVGINLSTTATGTTYYYRAAMKFSSVAPSANLNIMKLFAANSTEVILTTGGVVNVWSNQTLTNFIESGFKPEANKHYLFEVKCLIPAAGNATFALRIYDETGKTVYESGDKSQNLGNTKITFWEAGHISAGDTVVTIYVSHQALNDSTGESQNSWSGWATIVLLKARFDSARVGFTTGAGGTTELFKAVDNFPPVGVANGSKTAESQIYSANNNATDKYEAGVGPYSAPVAEGGGGIKEVDTIKCVMGIARGSNSTTTSRNLKLWVGFNPFIAAVTKGTGTTAGATEPTGWVTITTGVVYPTAGSITLSEHAWPLVEKGTASTNAMAYDMVGVYVEFVPGVLVTKVIAVGQAVETDSAQAASVRKRVALGQPTETDTVSGALARLKRQALGQPTETDTVSGALVRRHTRLVERALEADLARTLAAAKTLTLGRAFEVDAGQALSRRKTRLVAVTVETDAARALSVLRRLGLARAVEVDLASAILLPMPRLRPPFGARCFGEEPTLAVEMVGDRAVLSFVDSPTGVLELPARLRRARDLVGARGASSFGEEETGAGELVSAQRSAREL